MAGSKLSPSFVPFLVHRLPVPRPTSDPDTSPEVSVCFNEEWLPHVLACLKALVDPAAWQAANQSELDTVMKQSMLLMSMFAEAGPCVSPPGAGCFIADFLELDYEFVPDVGPGCSATYGPGGLWHSCTNTGGFAEIALSRLFSPAATEITFYEMTFDVLTAAVNTFATVTFLLAGSVTYTNTFNVFGPGVQTVSDTLNVQADEVRLDIVRNDLLGAGIELDKLQLCYVGAFPLSTAQPVWEHVFDFTIDDGGWTVVNAGTYVTGVGWVASDLVFAGTCYHGIHIHRTHTPVTYTSVEPVYSKTPGTYDDPGVRDTLVAYPGGSGVLLSSSSTAAGQVPSWAGVTVASDELEFSSTCDVNTSGTCYNDGTDVLTRLTVRGIGADPF